MLSNHEWSPPVPSAYLSWFWLRYPEFNMFNPEHIIWFHMNTSLKSTSVWGASVASGEAYRLACKAGLRLNEADASAQKRIAEAEDLFAKLCFRFCLSFRPLSTSLSPTQAEFEDLNFIPRGTLSRLKPHCEACAAFHISRYVFTIPSPLSTYTNCHEVLDHLPHYKILGSIQILIECWSEAQASNE